MEDNEKQILIYETDSGSIEVQLGRDSVWLTQAQMAELFQVKPQNITMHLKNIFADSELEESATCKDFLQVQDKGGRQVKRSRKHHNLDAIISVGYRVNSTNATRFRQWATARLKEHLIQGYTLNRQRFEANAKASSLG